MPEILLRFREGFAYTKDNSIRRKVITMARKALILYASVTGNTEKIANCFREALEEMNWAVDSIKITNQTNFVENPVFFDEYDLLFVGSPIMAGLPSTLIGKNLGLTASMPPRMYSDRLIMPGLKRPETPDYTPYAIEFATYGGTSTGPSECLATLAIEKLYLENLYIQTVGQFACLGTELHHASVDTIADDLNMSVDLASELLARFKKDPNAEEFKKYPPHIRGKIRQAANMGEQGPIHEPPELAKMSEEEKAMVKRAGVMPAEREQRPNADDKEAAKIFVRNVVKGYFPSEQGRREYGGEYISIS